METCCAPHSSAAIVSQKRLTSNNLRVHWAILVGQSFPLCGCGQTMLELQLTSGESESFFHLTVTGQLESAYFPMGPDGSGLFCRYDIVAGPDWELVSGLQSAVTQSARTESDYRTVVFNMPIEFTMKSTNPYGWPQIIFSLYGANVWNVETNRGYARVHCPLSGSHSAERTLRAPLFIPKYANACSAVMSWISGVNPEMRDPKILADGSKHKGLSSETYGELVVKLCAISRGSTRMALDWGQAALVDDKF